MDTEDLYYDPQYEMVKEDEGNIAAARWINERMTARGWPDRDTMDELIELATEDPWTEH
jgi:hypothetical protein